VLFGEHSSQYIIRGLFILRLKWKYCFFFEHILLLYTPTKNGTLSLSSIFLQITHVAHVACLPTFSHTHTHARYFFHTHIWRGFVCQHRLCRFLLYRRKHSIIYITHSGQAQKLMVSYYLLTLHFLYISLCVWCRAKKNVK